MAHIIVALDTMGGDYGPSVVVPAALLALQLNTELHVILVGDVPTIEKHLKAHHAASHERLTLRHASQQVEMDELPSVALRNKKDSSMRVAINLVKEGVANACVSAGNTGALMATARFVLKMLPGIDRPAIIGMLPTMKQNVNVRVLDLGANVDSTAEHLFQFAVMGSVLTQAVDNIERPRVGLLNVGQEVIKGNEQVKETARLLEENPAIHYIGYVEGDDIYKGVADVVVCDGFVGNVMLKTSEGLAKMIALYAKEAFQSNMLTRLCGGIAWPVLKKLKKRIDPGRYNGASLLGLQGIVIKSHGGANISAYANAIERAVLEVQKDVPQRIRSQVSHLLQAGPTL